MVAENVVPMNVIPIDRITRKVQIMRKTITATLVALASLAACTEPRSSGAPTGDLDRELAREVETLPTQDEADQKAASEITAANADAEYEALLQEIDQDTNDG